MNFLLLFVYPKLKVVLSDESCFFLESFEFQGEQFTKIAENITFDWITDPGGNVYGIELNICRDELFFLPNEREKISTLLDFSNPSAKFWFTEKKVEKAKMYLDWEDYYFRSKSGRIVICLKTHLLGDIEVASLKRMVSSYHN